MDCSSDEVRRFLSGEDVSFDFSLQSFSLAESTNSMLSASCVAVGGFVIMQAEVCYESTDRVVLISCVS